MAQSALLLVVALVVVAVLAAVWYMNQTPVVAPAPVVVNPAGNVPPGQNKPVVAPRPDYATINDCGYSDDIAGWYDAQKQGACNDYCRTVGPSPPDHPNTWIACVLAGRTDNDVMKPFTAAQIGARCEASTRAGIGCKPR